MTSGNIWLIVSLYSNNFKNCESDEGLTMNEHLEPIFKMVIPRIEETGISYWVFGGVAIAGIKGCFYREHQDIDIFVLNKDYKKIAGVIETVSKINLWETRTSIKNRRPKIEILIKDQERFSLVPIYEIGDEVEFIFPNGSKRFPKRLLESETRKVGTFKYITPGTSLIKKLLSYYLRVLAESKEPKRIDLLWGKYKLDAEKLLGVKQTKKFFTENVTLLRI